MKLSANAFQKLPFFLEPFFKAMAHKKHLCVCTVFLAAAKSRTLYLLAVDEYCRFDTSAFFWRINRASFVPRARHAGRKFTEIYGKTACVIHAHAMH
jgi:hypothetical protein